ncbi:MAG TPA: hypothetical protein VHU90_08750 [Galbitalea sp.]|nr:hypothetical protein [Galbitalea sp.]
MFQCWVVDGGADIYFERRTYRVVTTVAIVPVETDPSAAGGDVDACASHLESYLPRRTRGATVRPLPRDPGSYNVTYLTEASTLAEAIEHASIDLIKAAYAAGASMPGMKSPDGFHMWVTERFVRATVVEGM